ncbi:DUF2778 domain-containing protein [Desulfovibrio sp. OttesenSCG-928-G11]|nr:DUF2778 domain-containing protein [Desulfovibrio sp. OttesenSCG-928-G11]
MSSSYGKPYFPGKRHCILGEGAEEAQERQWSGGGVFSCQCRVSDKGKVTEKTETGPQGRDVFSYEYDAAGHLTMVRKNELISEFYEFDEGGRRVLDFRAWAGGKRRLTYNYDGTLIQAGNVHLKWTEQGQLAAIEEQGRRTAFYYGHDTRLDRALLADGTDIRYHYGNELMPVTITVNGATVAEYQWADKIRLLRYRDNRRGLNHDFLYADKRAPVKVLISGSAMDIYQATGFSVQRLELDIRTDQVNSIRALSLPDGRPVKYIEYGSFGNVISDSRPDWKFPLGFACGLNDPWTGLIRFGFRDYDPRFGRFTAKDPARDMRGDGDLWDYCIDDPVGSFDPTGLWTQRGNTIGAGPINAPSAVQSFGNGTLGASATTAQQSGDKRQTLDESAWRGQYRGYVKPLAGDSDSAPQQSSDKTLGTDEGGWRSQYRAYMEPLKHDIDLNPDFPWRRYPGERDYARAPRQIRPEVSRMLDISLKAAEAPVLSFDGRNLHWRQGEEVLSWPAYSGKEEYWKSNRFSPADQAARNLGPLPSGRYMVNQSTFQSIPRDEKQKFARMIGQGTFKGGWTPWGGERVWLQPEPDQEMYGRDHFSIHGGGKPGSAGCIDLVENNPEFMWLYRKYGKDLMLEVKYPEQQ